MVLLSLGVYFAKDAWTEFEEGRIIRRGEAAVAKAASGARDVS
ncbi:MAG: hypothetical protein ACOZQL_26515 [Myxococcota bacterium]